MSIKQIRAYDDIAAATAAARNLIEDCECSLGRTLCRGERKDLLIDNTTWSRSAIDDVMISIGEAPFADPGGRSALRAASRRNPRNLPCPNCGSANRLTPADRAKGYQCDECADQCERGGY